ncbi:TPA: G5 domain-containing protein [Streptococcus pneumoniae]|nr:G5 domain-containing protein [Streptococcus pneumoniae]
MSLLKKDKFSIRKIKGIVGSVFLGSLLFAPSVIGASTYHYLDYSSLTQTERDQLKQGRPDESKESYALDYEKDALPNTGSSQSIMTALGLLAIGSLIVIITKDNRNKKIATFLIVGATGLVTLSTASALNLNANIHESGRDGVLQISGYRYVGYLELDDKTVSSVSPASTVSPVEQPKVVTEKGEPEVQPALPEAVVTDKGEPEVQPTLPEAVVTDKGEPEVHEKPDYTQPIGANLVEPEVHEKLAYTEPVGTTGVDENGNLIEPPVNDIPEYTEPISTVSEVASEREELPSLHTDIRTETIPKTTIEESDPSKFIGDDSVKEVGEDGERQIVTSYEELHGKKISEPVETVTILKEMKPKILVKGTKENPKEKTVPVLTLTKVTEDAMNRSANLNYELDNKDNAEISSIIAEIKDGDTVVKKVDLSKEKLTDAVQNLDLFKDYKIATTMIYDRGQGSETSKLDEKTLRLELKKVEIKNISSTNLVKVNDDGTEIPSDFMSEKPSDEDVKKMYLKITSRDNKVTRLAVDKIELVTEKEKELYKITASAQDLIQHVDPSKTRNEYIHYIEKPVPKVNNVYYNFNELVRDMQEHPNDEFKLGADLNATNVSAFGKSYVTKDFKGKLLSDGDNHYTIHNLSRPLFGNVIGGTIKNINLGNVDINMPWANQVAAVANIIKGGTTIENVKVKGNIVGKDWVSGFIDKIDNQGTLRNVAFIGNVTSVGDGGQFLTGIVGENWKGLVERAYVNANLIGKKAKAAGIAYWTQNEGNNNTVRQEGAIKKSIAKGTIQVTEAIESGGVVGSMKHHGSVEDSVSMMKVPNGEIFYGSSDIDYDDGYWTGDNVRRNYVVIGVSDGHSSYQRSKDKNRIRPISEEEAKSKIEATGITADKYEINEPVVNRLNRLTRREDEYKSTQDYKVDRDLAYRNIEKLQPFYNKEWIVNQGNKLAEDSNLAKKEVLSVTGMKDGQFVTDLSDIDHVMIHYADKTKEIKAVHQKESKVAQVREYSIDGLDDIVYTPNMVDKNRDQLIKDIKDRLATVELISPEVRALMDKRDTSRDPNANSDERKNGYIRDLYFEESFSDKNAHMFLISTYNTMAYSSFEKYGKYTEAEREAFKDKIKEVAHAQQTYLDFWSRLALPSVRDQLLKSQNRVPTPVWDNQNYHNVEGVNRMGYDKNNKPIAPIRELYGPTWRYHTTNWYMGAMASIFQDPNNNDQVYFMGTNMISPFGISAFTHETTHVNDRMLYFGGHRHRQGTDVEAYAQGMLQTPDKSGNGEYGALGLNMAYHRENDGDQWYNYDPDKLKTREDIDRYMRNYNDALMMLDHLEADAVIPKLHGNISRWFKKMDRQYRKNGELHQFDKVRELTEDEKKKIVINNIDDLVNNNLMTKHGAPSDRTYNPEDFDSAYVNINIMTGIYGGNTSQGAPGAASFKHNTFRMWGYFGYENGFISYASSKYQGEADKTNKKLLGDDFIIKKVSKDKFNNLEEWKKQYFKDVKSKAEKGFTAIEIDGRQITNYAQLKTLFAEAVQKDIDGMSDPKIKDHFKNTVDLKSKVFKALLKNTDGFFNKLFKEDI